MVVSLRKMSAGDGYKYLLKTVVAGDGDRSLATPLTRYYAETGTPPGRWTGSGVRDLGLEEGTEVTEQQLELLIGYGRHPRTGEPLGRSYAIYAKGIKKKAVAGFDYTFSIPKSASVIWAVADAGTQAIITQRFEMSSTLWNARSLPPAPEPVGAKAGWPRSRRLA